MVETHGVRTGVVNFTINMCGDSWKKLLDLTTHFLLTDIGGVMWPNEGYHPMHNSHWP